MAMDDSISILPNEVSRHILSFLPTKDAVATSVLSKRWRPLCLSLPTLHFNDECVKDEKNHVAFVRFVYRVMLSQLVSQQPVKTFRLYCGFRCSDSIDFKNWVNATTQQRVENLDLWCGPELRRFDLPSSIFSCATLVTLKLDNFNVNAAANGFSFDLPSLRIMRLRSVDFFKCQYVMELLSACPILEDLEAMIIDYVIDSSTEGEFKSLPKLIKANVCYNCIPLKVVCNAEFLRIQQVCFESDPQEDNAIATFHNLTHLELIDADYPPDVVEILQHSPKLQNLVVVLKGASDKIYDENLVYPQFVAEHLRTCSLTNYGGLEGQLQLAAYIMRNAILLRTMTIRCTVDSDPQNKLQMITKLASLPRSSATCKLLFE